MKARSYRALNFRIDCDEIVRSNSVVRRMVRRNVSLLEEVLRETGGVDIAYTSQMLSGI
jgi:hypothetical protein